MKDWLEEVLTILGYSNRAAILLVAGITIALITLFVGALLADRYTFPPAEPGLGRLVLNYILEKYVEGALFFTFSALCAAYRQYKKDKARYYKMIGVRR